MSCEKLPGIGERLNGDTQSIVENLVSLIERNGGECPDKVLWWIAAVMNTVPQTKFVLHRAGRDILWRTIDRCPICVLVYAYTIFDISPQEALSAALHVKAETPAEKLLQAMVLARDATMAEKALEIVEEKICSISPAHCNFAKASVYPYVALHIKDDRQIAELIREAIKAVNNLPQREDEQVWQDFTLAKYVVVPEVIDVVSWIRILELFVYYQAAVVYLPRDLSGAYEYAKLACRIGEITGDFSACSMLIKTQILMGYFKEARQTCQKVLSNLEEKYHDIDIVFSIRANCFILDAYMRDYVDNKELMQILTYIPFVMWINPHQPAMFLATLRLLYPNAALGEAAESAIYYATIKTLETLSKVDVDSDAILNAVNLTCDDAKDRNKCREILEGKSPIWILVKTLERYGIVEKVEMNPTSLDFSKSVLSAVAISSAITATALALIKGNEEYIKNVVIPTHGKWSTVKRVMRELLEDKTRGAVKAHALFV